MKAATDEQEVDLDGELGITGPAVRETEVVWAPDSKRFACNYSPPHPHRFTVVQVAFYQLKGDQWERVEPDLTDEESSGLQLAELGKGRLPKGFNPAQCSDLVDVLKVRSWPDASRAVVYAPCHGRGNRENTGLLFTVKFDDAGKWKLVETRRMSEKELTEAEE